MSKRGILLIALAMPLLMGQFCGGPAPYTATEQGIIPGIYSGALTCTARSQASGAGGPWSDGPHETEEWAIVTIVADGVPQDDDGTPLVPGDSDEVDFGGVTMSVTVESVSTQTGKASIAYLVSMQIQGLEVAGTWNELYEQVSDDTVEAEVHLIAVSDDVPGSLFTYRSDCTATLNR